MAIKHLSIKLKNIPKKTGVYFFLGKAGKVLYVGKTIDIRGRIRSHFVNADTTNPAKAKLLQETRTVRWELLPSEPEALIREAELIKKLKPRYNVLLRDDKNYFYVGFTKEPFPKVFVTHQPSSATIDKKQLTIDRSNKQSHVKNHMSHVNFVGPFTDGASLKRVLAYLRKVIPYCICLKPHKRECLSESLGRCFGICCLQTPFPMSFPSLGHTRDKLQRESRLPPSLREEETADSNLPKPLLRKEGVSPEIKKIYRKNIKALEEVLRGKKQRLLAALGREMKTAAKEHRFEDAALLRDHIRALESVFGHASAIENNQINIAQERLRGLEELAKLLGLLQIPHRIEMYDTSNIQGMFAVGSMVVFTDGMPDKSQYRRFRIKTVKGSDDIAMMREIISRRLRHAPLPPSVIPAQAGIQIPNPGSRMIHKGIVLRPRSGSARISGMTPKRGVWPLPDVCCVDGGKAQVGVAITALNAYSSSLSRSIPILGLAKGRDELHIALAQNQKSKVKSQKYRLNIKSNFETKHYTQNATRSMSTLPRPLRHLLAHLQAEAHRFAITYYRKRHRAV